MPNFIRTPGGIHMVLCGVPYAVSSSDKHYDAVLTAVKANESEDAILAILEAEKQKLAAAITLTPNVVLKGGQVLYKDGPVHGVLVERMLEMLDEGFDLTPMANFLEHLMKNPSNRVVGHLYAFLERGKIPLTEDGHFLAYKAVRADFMDIHSGTMDNSVGKVVEMSRNAVNDDPEQTCSHGLHVCSFDYLPHFANANGHVVVCKINPADVVAIPRDYNDTKMRVCRYEVISEYAGYYKGEGDKLAGSTVAVADTDDMFTVERCPATDDDIENGVFVADDRVIVVGSAPDRQAAIDLAKETAERMPGYSFLVRNNVTARMVLLLSGDPDEYSDDMDED